MDVRKGGDTELIRKIRDPIHRYVKLTRIECRIVDSRVFQRLANISQMHSAHLVYPSARYSRKVHSLGAMHLAHRVFCRIMYRQYPGRIGSRLLLLDSPTRDKWLAPKLDLPAGITELRASGVRLRRLTPRNLPEYLAQAMRLAALLHDVGHGPYSHLLEMAARAGHAKFDHEEQAVGLVRDVLTRSRDPQTNQPLLETDDAELIARIISGDDLPNELAFMHDIVSSALDVDKLDYILRDSYFAGTPEYGTVDIDRVIEALLVATTNEGETRLAYSSNCIDAIISALNAMFFMYNNVYLHKTVQGFDFAAILGLRDAAPAIAALQGTAGDPASYEQFIDLAEYNVDEYLRQWKGRESSKADRYDRATEALEGLRWRRKSHYAIIDERITFPLAYLEEDYEISLNDIIHATRAAVSRFETSTGHHLEPNLGKNIRPVGLNLNDFLEFMQLENVYNVHTGDMEKFSAYSAYYKTLDRIVVPVRFFLDQHAFDALNGNQVGRAKIRRLRKDARAALEKHQRRIQGIR